MNLFTTDGPPCGGVVLTEVHSEDSLIFTPVVASLVQVLMDERCQTIDGFCELIEREWSLGVGLLQVFLPKRGPYSFSCLVDSKIV